MEGTKSVVEDIKFEEGKTNLSESQEQAIAQEAIAEALKEDKAKAGNTDDLVENNEELQKLRAEEAKEAEVAAAKEKEAADAKAKEEADKKAKLEEEERLKNETEAETKARKDKEAADAKIKEEADAKAKAAAGEQPFKIADENRAKVIEELALKESLTLKEAEEQLVKDEAIVNKYKKDPVEMARALRHTQSEMDKAKAELEATRKAAGKPPAPVINNIKEFVKGQLEPIREKSIAAYKAEYPELVDGQSDEFVFNLIQKDAIERSTKILEDNEAKIVTAAEARRAELINGLSTEDKAFMPDVLAQLKRCNPRQILDKTFDVMDIVAWAKGRQIDRLLKEAEERGFKRGSEKSTILGEKLPGARENKGGGDGAKKTSGSRLSDEQKERARNMFDGAPGMAEEEMFQAYIETYPEQFQK